MRSERLVAALVLLPVALLTVLTGLAPAAAARSLPGSPPEPAVERVAAAAAPSRPNILLIMTDDQTVADLQALRRTRAWFAQRGTVFRNAFAPYPLCCPARASVLTGQHAHNHGVLGNDAPWGGAEKLRDRETLPVWLRRAGYRTAYAGKYLNGYPQRGRERYVPPGWGQWQAPVAGAYNYRNYTLNVNGRLQPHSQYQAGFVRTRTARMVTRLARSRDPFFVWANFLAPHAGLPREPDDPRVRLPDGRRMGTPAVHPRHRNAFRGLRLPPKPSRNEADMSDKVRLLRNRPPLPLPALREQFQQRRESLLSVDEAVAGILDALRRTGEMRDTLVVLTSDNGFLSGEHRWNHKVLGYEESIRVPLLMAGPGVARGAVRTQLVSLVDLTATLTEAAGAAPGVVLDGFSLLPLTRDPALARDRTLLLEAGGWPFRRAHRLYTGVRTSDGQVLLRWRGGTEEVYDLRRDPYQLDGLVDAEEASVLPRLRELRQQLATCSGPSCWGLPPGALSPRR